MCELAGVVSKRACDDGNDRRKASVSHTTGWYELPDKVSSEQDSVNQERPVGTNR